MLVTGNAAPNVTPVAQYVTNRDKQRRNGREIRQTIRERMSATPRHNEPAPVAPAVNSCQTDGIVVFQRSCHRSRR